MEPAAGPESKPRVLVSERTPGGRILIGASDEPGPELSRRTEGRILAAFAEGPAAGVLHLGVAEPGTDLHPSLEFWRDLGRMFVAAACAALDPLEPETFIHPEPEPGALAGHAESVPPMPGAEFVTAEVLEGLWRDLGSVLAERARSVRPADSRAGYGRRAACGTWWGASASTSPRTAATRGTPSPSWRPTSTG